MQHGLKSSRRHRPHRKQTHTNPLLEARSQLELAEKLRLSGKLAKARKLCEDMLKRYPDYVAVLYTYGLVLADNRQYKEALFPLIQAEMLNPHDWKTSTVLAGVYLKLGAQKMAVRTLERAQELRPDDPNILGTLGEIYRDDREYEAAAEAYRKAWQLDPGLYDAQSGLGHSCTHLGELEEAAKAFSDLVKHRPNSLNLLYSLSQQPPDMIDVDLIDLLDNLTQENIQDAVLFESSVAFVRASALSKAGIHSKAWTQLLHANKLIFPEHKEANEKDMQFQKILLEASAKHENKSGWPKDDPDGPPISLFILGPSRSGKTTLERLIGSVRGVKRGYENPIVENSTRHTFQSAGLPTRDWIGELPPGLDDHFRELYGKELVRRAEDVKVFTNTHPGHVRSVLRIANVQPNVRFIFVKRDLDDITLRILMKKYGESNSYSYSVKTTREYVEWYYQMIDVIVEKLPDISMVVNYEDFVNSPATMLDVIAAWCGLDTSVGEISKIGDDRNCSEPYRKLIAAELSE